MKVSLQWFDTEKEKYSRYVRSSSVANRRVKKRENFKKEWEEYEESQGLINVGIEAL